MLSRWKKKDELLNQIAWVWILATPFTREILNLSVLWFSYLENEDNNNAYDRIIVWLIKIIYTISWHKVN